MSSLPAAFRPIVSRTIYCAALVTVVMVAALYLPASHQPQTVSAQQAVTHTPRTVATVAAATAAAPVPAACTPLDFTAPAQLDLAAMAPGLHVQADPSVQYRIYGNTAADLRTQIQHCGPGAGSSTGLSAEFAGQTDYALNWQYNAVPTGTGCVLTDVKVGLHTTIALPDWQSDNAAVPGLSSRWQAFITGLTVHEQGHAAIDKTYAAKLMSDLSTLTGPSCSALASEADAIANADAAALNQANDAYDAATDHGAAQGAILPAY